ncbi:MAG: AEC family transporter [Eubacterium sp.]|nr:AEC family transporter [Eubacterium sp.]
MSSFIVIQQMCVIMILVSIGIYLYKKKVIDQTVSQRISTIIIDICNPAMILSSALSGNVTASHNELLMAFLVGFLFYAGLVLLGVLLPILLRTGKSNRRFYTMMTVYTNIGFIGIPVTKALLPEKAMLYVVICNVLYALLFYTHGITVLSEGREKMNLKKIISPGTILAIISLIIIWFDYKPPVIISSSLTYIGNATVFLSMTLLGVSIARSRLMEGFKNIRLWGFIALRMILVPVMVFFLLRAFGCDNIMVLGFSLMAMMPVGNLPLIQAEKMGEDTGILSNGIAVTTIVSMATITLLMILFTGLLPVGS